MYEVIYTSMIFKFWKIDAQKFEVKNAMNQFKVILIFSSISIFTIPFHHKIEEVEKYIKWIIKQKNKKTKYYCIKVIE